MKIDLELIQILDAIDKYGSFEAAANVLNKVRSALTYQIQKYEEQLDLQILDRSGHRAQFTKAGRIILEQGRELLSLGCHIERTAKQAASGWETDVCIAYDEALSSTAILELVKKFHEHCNNVNLTLFSERLGGCTDALINHRADIAIGLSQLPSNRSPFIIETLGTVEFIFAVAPTHPLAGMPEPLSTQDIEKYPAIVASDSARHLMPQTTGLLLQQTKLTFTSMDMKYRAQLLGLGVGFLPYHLIKQALEEGKLIMKQVQRPKNQATYYIAWNKTGTGKALQWLISEIRDKHFQQKLLGASYSIE